MPGKLSFEDVLTTSTKQFFRNFHLVVLFTALGYLPLIVWTIALTHGVIERRSVEVFQDASFYLRIALDGFGASAIAVRIHRALHGERATLGTCLATAGRRFLPALGALVLAAIMTFAAMFLVVIPGLMILCATYVAVPAAANERLGPIAALRRSRELTRGHRLKILGLVVLIWVVAFLTMVIAIAIVSGTTGLRTGYETQPIYAWAILFTLMLFGALGSVTAAVLFSRLSDNDAGSDANLGKVFE